MKNKENYLRIGVLALAICLMIAGAVRGELLSVFVKAVNICLECIGLG